MALHGFAIVTMFAPMHECIHRTAFKTRALNDVFGWLAGVLCFYNSTYYRRYHTWHHRFTQDTQRDPELMTPKPRTVMQYAVHISGIPFWLHKPRELASLAAARATAAVHSAEARWTTAASAGRNWPCMPRRLPARWRFIRRWCGTTGSCQRCWRSRCCGPS